MNINFRKELRENRSLLKALLIVLGLIVFVWGVIAMIIQAEPEELVGPFPASTFTTGTPRAVIPVSGNQQATFTPAATRTGSITPIVLSTFTPRTAEPFMTATNREGLLPTPTLTPRPTNTPRPTLTPRPTNTPRPPTLTPRPTNTPRPPTLTPRPTNTPRPPTLTPRPTNTRRPPTLTRRPTNTPRPPTLTPRPTNTRRPPTLTPRPPNTSPPPQPTATKEVEPPPTTYP